MLNQSSYLSRSLWDYHEKGLHTDITLVCEDGSLPTHAAMLTGLFASFRIIFPSREEVPDCLFLPDLSIATVQEVLKDIYLKRDANRLLKILKNEFLVKLEVEDHEMKDTKCDIIDYSKEEIDHKEEDLKQSFSDNLSSFLQHSADNKILIPKTASKVEGQEIKVKQSKLSADNERGCKHCGDVFQGKSSLMKHMKWVHGYMKRLTGKKIIKDEVQYTECAYCEKNLKTSKTMYSHLALFHRDKAILNHPEMVMATPCKECDEKFYEIYDLDSHSRMVHKKRLRKRTRNVEYVGPDSQCPYCEKMCKKKYLNVHIFNSHKNMRDLHPELAANFDCALCDKKFYNNASRKLHTRIYHTEGGKCDECSKLFHNDHALMNHKTTHNGETHICDLCSKTFTTKIQLKRHIQKHNGFNFQDNYKYKCTECKRGKYATEGGLEKHMLEFHSGKEYMCTHCPSTFSNTDNLRIHEKRVHGEKLFKCTECESGFPIEYYLKQHMEKVHVKPTDKICIYCGEEFDINQYGTYQAHVNRHKNIRPFSCETCGKDFLTAVHLQHHKKSHTLPYKCNKCGARKSSSGQLTNHMKQVHHDGDQENCRFLCGFGTWQIATRGRHEKDCSVNPMPGAPYTVAMGKASSYDLQNYTDSLKD